MSRAEAELQISEKRRQAILDHFGDYLRRYAEDHPSLDDLGKKQIRDALVLIIQGDEITDDRITFGRAVVLAKMLGINTLNKAFRPDLSSEEIKRIIREDVRLTVNETAIWLTGREPKDNQQLSLDDCLERLNQLANQDLPLVASIPYVHINAGKPGRPRRGVLANLI